MTRKEFRAMLVRLGIVDPDAIDDPEGYDDGKIFNAVDIAYDNIFLELQFSETKD